MALATESNRLVVNDSLIAARKFPTDGVLPVGVVKCIQSLILMRLRIKIERCIVHAASHKSTRKEGCIHGTTETSYSHHAGA